MNSLYQLVFSGTFYYWTFKPLNSAGSMAPSMIILGWSWIIINSSYMNDPIDHGQSLQHHFAVRLDCLSGSQFVRLTDGIIQDLLDDLNLLCSGLLQLVWVFQNGLHQREGLQNDLGLQTSWIELPSPWCRIRWQALKPPCTHSGCSRRHQGADVVDPHWVYRPNTSTIQAY